MKKEQKQEARIISCPPEVLALIESTVKTYHEKPALQRQIDATDHQIDQLVYELYGLTEEDIKTVEGQ